VRRLALLIPLVMIIAACGGGDQPPTVTFAAGSATITAKPAQYCDVKATSCTNDADAPVQLAVPPGTPLKVTVPEAISSTPWQVVFSYRDATGAQQDERTSVFAPNARTDTTIALDPGARLITAQVQQFGPAPQASADGGVDFPIRGAWVLNTVS
jgi:hypothetical protein